MKDHPMGIYSTIKAWDELAKEKADEWASFTPEQRATIRAAHEAHDDKIEHGKREWWHGFMVGIAAMGVVYGVVVRLCS